MVAESRDSSRVCSNLGDLFLVFRREIFRGKSGKLERVKLDLLENRTLSFATTIELLFGAS